MLNKEVCKKCREVFLREKNVEKEEMIVWFPIDDSLWDDEGVVSCYGKWGTRICEVKGIPVHCPYELEHVVEGGRYHVKERGM